MADYILALDQGTTGSTALLIDGQGAIVAKATEEFEQHFPKPSWVEHDTHQIWASIVNALDKVLKTSGISANDIACIGITNQRETTVVWDKKSGAPIHKAIVWQDRRTADHCKELTDAGHQPTIRAKTGLVIDAYFSGTKVAWILDAVDGARARASELAFGTIDCWLVNKLTGGQVHVTDATNASRTMLYDIVQERWDDGLCDLLRVPMDLLPEVKSSSEVYGTTQGVPGLPDGIPIAGMAGDQQAALFGQTCFNVGDAKCTYGTGAFLLMNTGDTPVISEHGLVTTIGWRLGGKTTYALEGSAFIAGAAVQWLRDGLGLIKSAPDIEALAKQVDSAGDVVVVPAFSGLGAPHWDPHARGMIAGLTRDSTAAHIARATLEGIAFQIVDLVRAMEADAGRSLSRMRVDGGAANNDLLMQFQTDTLNVVIDRPASVETTSLGAAYLAGLAVGLFADLDSVDKVHQIERSFEPKMDEQVRAAHLSRWQAAIDRARSNVG